MSSKILKERFAFQNVALSRAPDGFSERLRYSDALDLLEWRDIFSFSLIFG